MPGCIARAIAFRSPVAKRRAVGELLARRGRPRSARCRRAARARCRDPGPASRRAVRLLAAVASWSRCSRTSRSPAPNARLFALWPPSSGRPVDDRLRLSLGLELARREPPAHDAVARARGRDSRRAPRRRCRRPGRRWRARPACRRRPGRGTPTTPPRRRLAAHRRVEVAARRDGELAHAAEPLATSTAQKPSGSVEARRCPGARGCTRRRPSQSGSRSRAAYREPERQAGGIESRRSPRAPCKIADPRPGNVSSKMASGEPVSEGKSARGNGAGFPRENRPFPYCNRRAVCVLLITVVSLVPEAQHGSHITGRHAMATKKEDCRTEEVRQEVARRPAARRRPRRRPPRSPARSAPRTPHS